MSLVTENAKEEDIDHIIEKYQRVIDILKEMKSTFPTQEENNPKRPRTE